MVEKGLINFKSLLFVFLFLFIPNAYAKEINVNQYTSGSFNGTKNQYKATEIYNSGTEHTYNLNTRYNGTLSKIDYYIHYPFESGYTYTITMNMATNDWRNKFMGVFVTDAEHDENTNLSNHNVTFISRQKIRFTFTTTQNVTDIKVVLYSTSVADIPFTGETNWNLSSIILDDPFYNSSSGGSSGGSGSGSTDSTNNDIINNNTQNTQDIIDNANNNTQDIINNQNENLRDYCKNLIDMPSVSEYNFYLSENLKPYTTYAFSYNAGNVSYNIRDSHNGELLASCGTSHTCVFTTNANGTAFFNGWNGTFPLTNFMLIEGSTPTYYCKYGSYTNRLDSVIDAALTGANSILDNANNNTQKQIDSQKVCTNVLSNGVGISADNKYLGPTGNEVSFNGTSISNYIEINENSTIKMLYTSNYLSYACFYDINKSLVSCFKINNYVQDDIIPVPTNARYFRTSYYKEYNRPIYEIKTCKDGNQAISDSLTDDNVDSGTGSDFFNSFSDTDNGGISTIITKPLVLINSLLDNNNSCADLPLNIDFNGLATSNVSLPSGCVLWNNVPTAISTLYQTFVVGFCSYYLIKRLFNDIQSLKNPDDDRVEVTDL